MSDKTRQEFEAWLTTSEFHRKDFFCEADAAYVAWQHQQAVIDTRDVEIDRLLHEVDKLKYEAKYGSVK